MIERNKDPEFTSRSRRGQASRKLYKDIPMRSQWEVVFAAYLDHKGLTWKYEPRSFDLKNGSSYIPDFWVEEWKTYIEVKPSWRLSEGMEKGAAFRNLGFVIEVVTDEHINSVSEELGTLPLKVASITKEKVLSIARALERGDKQTNIAKELKVSFPIIQTIAAKRSWAWLTKDFKFPGKVRGEKHHLSKLTEEKVREIRSMLVRGETQQVLSERFGVSQGNINAIKNRKTWKHVT